MNDSGTPPTSAAAEAGSAAAGRAQRGNPTPGPPSLGKLGWFRRRIALTYLALGALCILLLGNILTILVIDQKKRDTLETAKGLVFILVTGGLSYALLRRNAATEPRSAEEGERVPISPVLDQRGEIPKFVPAKEDVTEQRRMEEHLRHLQRMESVGSLASGIAHDLNNILAPVLMAAGLLKDSVRNEQEQTLVDIVEQSAQRGANLVKQLLTFSRSGGGKRIRVDLKPILDEMRRILAETFPRDISQRFDIAPDLPQVLCDPTQMHQVLLNLCVNARDAMPLGGSLTVSAQGLVIDANIARLNPQAKSGPHLLLQVADTGQGMTPEIAARIFDPFFTTKEIGKGTGLGLSTSLGIVRSHGGFISVETEPAMGSTFSVYLPAAAPELISPHATDAAPDPHRGNAELILVVDDEAAVVLSMRLALEASGYRVLAANGSLQGLALFKQRAAEISLVISDIMMPEMNGADMLRHMFEMRADLKALVTTGLASASKHSELAALGIHSSLAKPCSRSDLLAAVSIALKAAPPKRTRAGQIAGR